MHFIFYWFIWLHYAVFWCWYCSGHEIPAPCCPRINTSELYAGYNMSIRITSPSTVFRKTGVPERNASLASFQVGCSASGVKTPVSLASHVPSTTSGAVTEPPLSSELPPLEQQRLLVIASYIVLMSFILFKFNCFMQFQLSNQ